MGVIYDGQDIGRYLRIAYDETLAPPVEIDSVKVPGRDGELFRRSKLGSKKIPMRLHLRALPGVDMAEYRRRVAPLLVKDKPRKLILPGDRDRYYMAILSGDSSLDTLWYTGSADVTFVCPDPIAYGRERACTMTPGISGEYVGTYPTSPRFMTAPGTGSSFMVTNNKTGEFVQVNHVFSAGQTLIIDCEECRATINGVTVPVTFASDYFRLEPGEFSVTATSAATMQFTERWL